MRPLLLQAPPILPKRVVVGQRSSSSILESTRVRFTVGTCRRTIATPSIVAAAPFVNHRNHHQHQQLLSYRRHRHGGGGCSGGTGLSLPLQAASFSSTITDHATGSSNGQSNDNSSSNINSSDDESDGDNDRTEYENWVRRLYMTNMYNPVKLGLENIERLHDLLGCPMDDPKVAVIHIAGTNGKGSVALKIAKTLELMDLKVGLFCSPHISSFRERMQINQQLITEQEVVDYLPHIYRLCQEHNIPATFFEITTALAFYFYQQHHADVVVLETGLGGRLDSTNVIKNPACSVITSIGLEHTRILGDTVEKIALEKGGIIKAQRPVLVGPNVPHDVLRQCASERNASGYYQCDDLLLSGEEEGGEASQQQESVPATSDELDYDLENARIAAAAIRLVVEQEKRIPKLTGPIPESIIQQGTSQRPPCRFECVERPDDGLHVILDVAHNPPAMKYLMQKLESTYRSSKVRVIVGMSSDKDTNLCGRYLLEGCRDNPESIHLVQAAHPRAARLEDILERDASGLLGESHYDLEDRSVTRQIELGLELARKNGEILVVCGSVFLMAEAREALGFDEPRDTKCIAEVAGAHLKAAQENFQQK